MNDTGLIHIKNYYNTLGKIERQEYKWVGKPIAEISTELIDDMHWITYGDSEFSIGPYRVRIIDQEKRFTANYITVVRKDYPFWWVIIAWHRINRLLDIAYHRLILTLAVWRLASYNQAQIPTWRDIYLVQWIRKLW